MGLRYSRKSFLFLRLPWLAGPIAPAELAAGPINIELSATGGSDGSLKVSSDDRRKLALRGCGLIASRQLPGLPNNVFLRYFGKITTWYL
jgi:hypothetical protein